MAQLLQEAERTCEVVSAEPFGVGDSEPLDATAPAGDEALVPVLVGETPTGGIPALVADWLEKVRHDLSSSYHLHPHVLLARSASGSDSPRLFARYATPACGGPAALQSVAALETDSFPVRFLPGLSLGWSLRVLRLIGNQVLGEVGTLEAFVGGMREVLTSGDCDFVHFEDVEVDSPLWRTFEDAARRGEVRLSYPTKPYRRWFIRFPDEPQEYWAKFSARSRGNLRRRAKKFGTKLHVYTRPEEVASFVEKAHEVSLETWQSKRRGVRFTSTLKKQHRYERLARLGMLRSYVLEHDGVPAAFALGTQWNGVFAYEQSGFDQQFIEYAPGTVLLVRIIEDLIARQTPRLLDFGLGDWEYKELMGTDFTWHGSMMVYRRSPRTMLAMALNALGLGLRTGIHGALDRLGLLAFVRRLYRR